MTKKVYKFSDQVVGQIRELLTLCMITQQNFVDHCRAVRLEESEANPGTLILSKEYVDGWNEMGEKLQKQAEAKAAQQATTLAVDEGEEVEETEIVVSRDPVTGKLVGTREKVKAN
jgi:hypothetical protein